jgi:predicted DCC family thiol-disulfide oxidoreductase YuxK
VTPEPPILLFDGVCNLCSKAVHFVLEHEADPSVRFASLQSDFGKALLAKHGLSHVVAEADPESLVFVEEGRAYERSTGALRLAGHLRAPWRWGRVLLLVPRFLRDLVYRFIAKHRYRWFGKSDSCLVPTKELRARFLDQG